MKVLFMEWKSLGQSDIAEEFAARGWEVAYYPFPRKKENTRLNKELCEKMIREIASGKYDFVFSFNYFPVISIACNACRVKYVSWTFDSPFIQLYSNTIGFPYNYVFIFDRGTCEDLRSKGINTVYHLPMAASVKRYDTYSISDSEKSAIRLRFLLLVPLIRRKRTGFMKGWMVSADIPKDIWTAAYRCRNKFMGNSCWNRCFVRKLWRI